MSMFKKKELAVVEKHEILPVTEQTITDYMKAFGLAGGLLDNEVEAFKQMAIMHNLNPFNREIYCTAYGSGEYRTLSIVTGYEVYIRKAEKSGILEYWMVEEAPPETPIEKYYATLIVKRTDKAKEQKWTTHFTEAVQRKRSGEVTAFWKKQPRMMTKKVVMSQGFRLFFEDVMHGIPYTREEMPEGKGGMTDITPQPKEIVYKNKVTSPLEIKEEYEKAKEAVIEENYNRNDPVLPQKPKGQESPLQGNFSNIITLVNGQGIPNEDKVRILSDARACNKDEEKLLELLKSIKSKYNI